jgi:hypothetical protein
MKFGIIASVILSLVFLGFLIADFVAAIPYTNTTIAFNNSAPNRGEAILVYAQWNETVNRSMITVYSTAGPSGFTTAVLSGNSSILNSTLTNYSITTNTSGLLGQFNVTIYVNSTVNGSAADGLHLNVTSANFTLWGWSNTTAYNNVSYMKSGQAVLTSCLVNDTNTSTALSSYYVEIYNGTSSLTAGTSAASGWFNYSWVPVVEGTTAMTCAIYNNATQYYNVSTNGTASLIADFTNPVLNNTVPANNSYIQGLGSEWFNASVYDTNLNASNVTVHYRSQPDGAWNDKYMVCADNAPSFTCSNTSDLSGFGAGTVIGFYFEATDNATNYASNGTASAPLTATIDRAAPRWIYNTTNVTNATTVVKGTIIGLFVNWTDNHALNNYWLSNDSSTSWVNDTAQTFSTAWSNFTINTSIIDVGTTFQANIFANDRAGNENVSLTYSWTVDGTAPQFVNNVTSVANGTQYAPGRRYGFQIDFTDNTGLGTGVDTVIFEWNGTNSTGGDLSNLINNTYKTGVGGNVSKTGDTYYFNSTDLPRAIYQYKWYANDTSGNWNASHPVVLYYVITNATNPVNLYLNGTLNQNLTVTYPAQVNATAVAVYSSSGDIALYRNLTDATSDNGQNVRLAAGFYNYTANITGNNNYTDNSTGATFNITVSQGTPTISLTASSGWTTTSQTPTITCSITSLNDEANITLYRNNTNITNSSVDAILDTAWLAVDTSTLAAGAWNFTCNNTATTNYTTATNSSILTVQGAGYISGYIFLTNTTTAIQGVTVSTGTTGIDIGYSDSTGYYHISGVPAGTYTVTASKTGYYANSTSSVSVSIGQTTQKNISITGPENYNFTIPGKATPSFWDAGWHSFSMSPLVFTDMGISNHNFTNIFSSVNGNYTIIYGFNATSGSWISYIRDETSNDFYGAASSIGNYYIYANATDRVEIGRKY